MFKLACRISVFLASIAWVAQLLFGADSSISYRKVPPFKLLERSGKEISLSDLKGKVWIADFIFTRCQTMCPLMTKQMKLLQDRLPADHIQLVSFSVDPEHDTPDVLSKYAAKFAIEKSNWFFLTGKKDEVWKLVTEGFQLGVGDVTAEEIKQGAQPIFHSDRFVLIDQDGNIRGYFDSSEPKQLDELVKEAESLLSRTNEH